MKCWPLDPTCLFTLKRKLWDEDNREDQPGKRTDWRRVKKWRRNTVVEEMPLRHRLVGRGYLCISSLPSGRSEHWRRSGRSHPRDPDGISNSSTWPGWGVGMSARSSVCRASLHGSSCAGRLRTFLPASSPVLVLDGASVCPRLEGHFLVGGKWKQEIMGCSDCQGFVEILCFGSQLLLSPFGLSLFTCTSTMVSGYAEATSPGHRATDAGLPVGVANRSSL